MFDLFRSFALEGLALPVFMIAFGSAIILFPKREHRQFTREELEPYHPVLRWLATRNWDERKLGWFMIAGAILTAFLRLRR